MDSPWHARKMAAALVALSVVIVNPGCTETTAIETVEVQLQPGEVYQHPTVGGDEEGAWISVQASHYAISEIRRGAETNWVAVYVYQPAPGFVGTDYAELELLSVEVGGPSTVRTLAFRFVVHD